MSNSNFGRFCLIFVSAEWIIFGSMHFSLVEATVAQVPTYLPSRRSLAITSGMLEVATGILILIPELRKWAAAASLALLVLLLPAMHHILADPAALSGLPAWAQTVFRVLLIPNNIFLGICSVHLWRHPHFAVVKSVPPRRIRPKFALIDRASPTALIVAAILFLANAAGFFAVMVGTKANFGTAHLWSMACLATGALIGFLFAVPRVNPGAPPARRLLPNTNVEAVSDWLTKILVGVGLVNFKEIGAFVQQISALLAKSVAPGDSAFATGLIVYFFIAGLIEGYVLTRIFLAAQFDAADADYARDASLAS